MFCIAAGSLLTCTALAQQERVLQQVDLTLPGNKPFYSYNYLLPGLVLQGIQHGKIKPYSIDYKTNTMVPLSPAAYWQSLEVEVMLLDEVESPDVENYVLGPWDLNRLALDVTKEKGVLKKINYLHFSSIDQQTGLLKYHFSVVFHELAAYLDDSRALWVRNGSPIHWRGQVLHTYGDFLGDLLAQVMPVPAREEHYLHLVKDSQGQYGQMALYNRNHQLVQASPYQSLVSRQAGSEVRWLREALAMGLYQVGVAPPLFRQEPEVKLTTTLPEARASAGPRKPPVAFSIIQKDKIYLNHPANQQFSQPGRELFTLIRQAVLAGQVPALYASDSLNRRLTLTEWQQGFDEHMTGIHGSDSLGATVVHTYEGRDMGGFYLSWKVYFNAAGEVTARKPHALGFFIDADKTMAGFEKATGYYAFADVQQALEKSGQADYVRDLLNQQYFGYWVNVSGMEAAPAQRAHKKREKRK